MPLVLACPALALAVTGLAADATPKICERIAVTPASMPNDANILPLYAIEKAGWVWHPEFPMGQEAVLLFRNEVDVAETTDVVIHVSADQRYELSLDGNLISLGPDRSDFAHWSFASYRLHLTKGRHAFEALVAWIGDHAPCAQVTQRGGFILACEGSLAEKLNTGRGAWMTREVKGWSFSPGVPPNFTGAQQTIDGAALFDPRQAFVKAVEIVPPLRGNPYGLMRTSWRLYPSPLPDQKLVATRTGAIRAIIDGATTAPVTAEQCARAAKTPEWGKLIEGSGAVTVPANTAVSVLVDLQNYFTAYPRLKLSGGRGAKVSVGWAEGLYEVEANGKRARSKGNRDEVVGKVFYGNTDTVVSDGGSGRDYRTWWWRAGRYLQLTVRTAEQPLTLDQFDLLESRYPLEDESRFVTSDAELNAINPLLVRGLQMCAHETYMDCPYYEQLMYVGDTRLEMLTTYQMTPDTRLPKRGIELYDWSRATWGLVAEHYPSRTPQLSPTFSLIWISMVRDFAFWRDDPDFVRQRLTGVRSVIEEFRALRGPSGLLEQVPGWPFVDWVPVWSVGNAPDGIKGISSINNLFFVQSLLHAADLEDAVGEPVMAKRDRDLARRLSDEIVKRFWVPERGLLADDEKHLSFSEHAQCLALLNGVLDATQTKQCFASLLEAKDLHRATVYFSFYLFEAFRQQGRGDLIVERFGFWKDLVKQGFKTPVEMPEPSRSDCHAWGSHPLFHERASLFGIRPSASGFHEVEIAPLPGGLKRLEVRSPHPRGWIEGWLEFDYEQGKCRGEIALPQGVKGVFRWRGTELALEGGRLTAIH